MVVRESVQMCTKLIIVFFVVFGGADCTSVLVGTTKGALLFDPNHSSVVLNHNVPVYCLDYHYHFQYLFYCEDGSIKKRDLNFSKLPSTDVYQYEKLYYANSLAVDWINHQLYWTIGRRSKVYKADLDGEESTVIVERDKEEEKLTDIKFLSKIVLDPFAEKLFILAFASDLREKDQKMTIITSDLLGRNVARLPDHFKSVYSISLDIQSQRIYAAGILAGQNFGIVYTTTYEGAGQRIFHKPANSLVYPIQVVGNSIYMATKDVITAHGSSVLTKKSTKPTSSGEKELTLRVFESVHVHSLRHGANLIFDMKAVDFKAQLLPNEFEFAKCKRLDVCSYQCVALPSSGAACACQPNERLDIDGKSCIDDAEVEFLLADDESITKGSKKGIDGKMQVTVIASKGAAAITYDYFLNYVFFFNQPDKTIYRTSLSDEDDLKKIAWVNEVSALAVDRWHSNLYWAEEKGIVMSTLEGALQNTIINKNNELYRFTDIQIVPFSNVMFVVAENQKSEGKLVKTSLHGDNPQKLLKDDFSIKTITIDSKSQQVYILHCYKQSIEFKVLVTDYQLREVQAITFDSDFKGLLSGVHRMDFYEGGLYFSVLDKENVGTLYSTSTINSNYVFNKMSNGLQLQNLTDMRTVSPWVQFSPEDQKCIVHGCSHVCTPITNDLLSVQCGCPETTHIRLSDKKTCKKIVPPRKYPVVFPATPPPPEISTASYTLHYILLVVIVVIVAIVSVFCYWMKHGIEIGRNRYEYQPNWWRHSHRPSVTESSVDMRLRPMGGGEKHRRREGNKLNP